MKPVREAIALLHSTDGPSRSSSGSDAPRAAIGYEKPRRGKWFASLFIQKIVPGQP
jgi:hypothetical protein